MSPRKQFLPLLLLTPTIVAAANRPTTQPTSQPERVILYTFTGTTTAITLRSDFKGMAAFAEFDANFALTITHITLLSGTLPAHPANTLTFLIHSPAFEGADPDSFKPETHTFEVIQFGEVIKLAIAPTPPPSPPTKTNTPKKP